MNQYTLDGVPLKDPQLRWFTDRKTGIRIVPARRTPEHRFPGVDGVVFSPDSPYDPGSVLLSLEVHGEDYADFRKNLEFITGLITQRGRPLELRDHYTDSSLDDRVAQVSLSSSVEPVMLTRQSARVSVIFSVPGVFWRSAGIHVGSLSPITSELTTADLISVQGGNAPIDDLMFRIQGGQFSSLYIEDVVSGSGLNINTHLAEDETLLIDSDWNATRIKSAGDTWDNEQGIKINDVVVPNRGYGTMFQTAPLVDIQAGSFTYRVKYQGTNVSGKPFITYRGRKSYL